jgi:hypothetical protein
MRQLLRSVTAVSTGALLAIVMMPGVAAAKTVSNQQYAESYCDPIEAWLDNLNGVETEAQSASDPAAFRASALAAVDALLASLQTAAAKLHGLAPKDGGKKVAALFDATLAGQAAAIQAARDKFAAADTSGSAFGEAVGTLLTDGVAAANTFDEPLAKLAKHRALRRAVKSSCDIVRTTRS